MPSDDIILKLAGKMDRIEGALGRLDGKLTKTQRKTKSMGQEAQAWAGKMVTGWASAATALGVVAVTVTSIVKGLQAGVREVQALEKTARLVAALTGSTPEKVIKKYAPLGAKYGLTPDELLGPEGASFKAISRTLGEKRTARVLENVAPAMFLGEAGAGGAGTLADIVKRRQLEGAGITGAANIGAMASRGSKATFTEWGKAFNEPDIIAKNMGMSLARSAALFSAAEEASPDTAKARPTARQFMLNLLAPESKRSQDILDSVKAREPGIDIYARMERLKKLNAIQLRQVFGGETLAVAQELTRDPERIRAMEKRYQQAFEDPESLWKQSFEKMREASPATALAVQKARQDWEEKEQLMKKGAVGGASAITSAEHHLRMRAGKTGIAGGAAPYVGAMQYGADIQREVTGHMIPGYGIGTSLINTIGAAATWWGYSSDNDPVGRTKQAADSLNSAAKNLNNATVENK